MELNKVKIRQICRVFGKENKYFLSPSISSNLDIVLILFSVLVKKFDDDILRSTFGII